MDNHEASIQEPIKEAKPHVKRFDDISPCGNIYYPSTSPFRKQFQEQDRERESLRKKVSKRLILIMIAVVFVILILVFYFILLGEIVTVHSILNQMRQGPAMQPNCQEDSNSIDTIKKFVDLGGNPIMEAGNATTTEKI